MPVSGYFDGSGTQGPRITTLRGIIATDTNWSLFAKEWNEILANYGIRSWHTKDAVACRKEFSRFSKEQNLAIMRELLNPLLKLLNGPAKIVTTTIDKLDWQAVVDEHKNLDIPGWERMLVRHTLGQISIEEKDEGREGVIKLFFDQNEPFIDCVYKVWIKLRAEAKRLRSGWARQVAKIEQINSATSAPLQAVYLLAWLTRTAYQHEQSRLGPLYQKILAVRGSRALIPRCLGCIGVLWLSSMSYL